MRTNVIVHILAGLGILWSIVAFGGCAAKHDDPPFYEAGAQRLVAKGVVTDSEGQALQSITVAMYGVREANEPDLLSYNYAITDSAGEYRIIRYAGRDELVEVTLVATDSANIYAEQVKVVPVTYEPMAIEHMDIQVLVASVTADFVLEKR